MTMMTFLPASGGEREPQHRRVRLDPLCHILASRLRHAAIQSLRSPQGAFFLLYYDIHDHHLHHR